MWFVSQYSVNARSIDTQQKHMPEVLKRAHAHKGASFVEIYQNCIVYNDGVFADFTDKPVADDNQLHLEHGQPMIFGKERNKGIRMVPGTFELEVVTIGENGIGEGDILVHDETNRVLAGLLVLVFSSDRLLDAGLPPLISRTDGAALLCFFIVFLYHIVGSAVSIPPDQAQAAGRAHSSASILAAVAGGLGCGSHDGLSSRLHGLAEFSRSIPLQSERS